jgi:site-specific DNA-methyltransferase (adenine-specific)
MDEYEEHPSQKPEALLERIIQASSNPGDTILDPFSGTFTTSAVAERLGRKSIGIDQHKDYVAIGLRRLGIARTFLGEELRPVAKSTKRRNAAGVRSVNTPTQFLFETTP